MKKFGLVLAGGGARGLAEIGVLKVLEKYNLFPDVITGTSMGGMIGGFYAAGITPLEMEEYAKNVVFGKLLDTKYSLYLIEQRKSNRAKLAKYFSIGASLSSLAKNKALDSGRKVEYFIHQILGEKTFSDLRIPFACIGADLVSGKRIVFNSGKLYKAIRATISIPLVFEPVEYNGMLIVDGGIVSNAPVDIARKMGAEAVLVIDVNGDIEKKKKESFKTPIDIAWRVYEITQNHLYKKELEEGDMVIRTGIDLDTLDFSKNEECIGKGEEDTEREIERIKKLLEG